jgi:hypothetical protein
MIPGRVISLQMPTGLAELHTEALDLADPEAFANEAVHIHVAHSHRIPAAEASSTLCSGANEFAQ